MVLTDEAQRSPSSTAYSSSGNRGTHGAVEFFSGCSFKPASASNSPAKHREKMSSDYGQVSACNNPVYEQMENAREHIKQIDDLPTLGQPVLNTTLKDMLVYLCH